MVFMFLYSFTERKKPKTPSFLLFIAYRLVFFSFSFLLFFSGGENPLPVFPGELVSPYFWYFVRGRLIN